MIGARLAINAWQSKAGLKFYPNTGDNSLDALKGDYKWKWNYIAPTVDITFNLSNLISGVNPKRVFSVGAFAGIGANIAWGNSEAADVNRTLKPALGYAYNHFGRYSYHRSRRGSGSPGLPLGRHEDPFRDPGWSDR